MNAVGAPEIAGLIHGFGLSESHRGQLRASGISDETMESLGWASVSDPPTLSALLGRSWRGTGGGLVIVYSGPSGELWDARVRRDQPRPDVRKPGRTIKYEQPSDRVPSPFVPGIAWQHVRDVAQPLVIVEGEKKALAVAQLGYAVVGLAGIWSFSAGRGTRALHPRFGEVIPLRGRRCVVIFDFDPDETTRRTVDAAARLLARRLREAGAAAVGVAYPAGANEKVGVDDLLAKEGDGAVRALIAPYVATAVVDEDARAIPVDAQPLHESDWTASSQPKEPLRWQRKGSVRSVASPLTPDDPRLGLPIVAFETLFFAPIPLDVLRQGDLPARAKLLFGLIAQGDGYWSSRSQRRLGRALRCDAKTVGRLAKQLAEALLIRIIPGSAARHETNRYQCIESVRLPSCALASPYILPLVPPVAACVAAVMRRKAGKAGWAKVSYEELASAVGVAASTARRAVRELREARIIVVNDGVERRGMCHIYRFALHPHAALDLRAGVTVDDLLELRPAPVTSERGEVAGQPPLRSVDPGQLGGVAPIEGSPKAPGERKLNRSHDGMREASPPAPSRGGEGRSFVDARQVRALEVHWREVYLRTLGADAPTPSSWDDGDRAVARRLLQEQAPDSVMADVTYFVATWCGERAKHPNLRLLLAVRDEIRAARLGFGPDRWRRKRLHGQYDAEGAKGLPRIGWGPRGGKAERDKLSGCR